MTTSHDTYRHLPYLSQRSLARRCSQSMASQEVFKFNLLRGRFTLLCFLPLSCTPAHLPAQETMIIHQQNHSYSRRDRYHSRVAYCKRSKAGGVESLGMRLTHESYLLQRWALRQQKCGFHYLRLHGPCVELTRRPSYLCSSMAIAMGATACIAKEDSEGAFICSCHMYSYTM